jgi:hypothetical protein
MGTLIAETAADTNAHRAQRTCRSAYQRKKAGQIDRPSPSRACPVRALALTAAILRQLRLLFRRLRGRVDRVFIQALFEGTNAFTKTLAHAGKPTRSEQEQDDD